MVSQKTYRKQIMEEFKIGNRCKLIKKDQITGRETVYHGIIISIGSMGVDISASVDRSNMELLSIRTDNHDIISIGNGRIEHIE